MGWRVQGSQVAASTLKGIKACVGVDKRWSAHDIPEFYDVWKSNLSTLYVANELQTFNNCRKMPSGYMMWTLFPFQIGTELRFNTINTIPWNEHGVKMFVLNNWLLIALVLVMNNSSSVSSDKEGLGTTMSDRLQGKVMDQCAYRLNSLRFETTEAASQGKL